MHTRVASGLKTKKINNLKKRKSELPEWPASVTVVSSPKAGSLSNEHTSVRAVKMRHKTPDRIGVTKFPHD